MIKYSYAICRCLKVLLQVLKRGYFRPSAKKILNIGNNKKCYILGNGPSLLNEFLILEDTLAREQTFVVNNFAKSEHYSKIKPAFYVLLDPIFFDDRAILDNGFEVNARAIIDIILQKTTWPLKIVVASEGCEFLKNRFKTNPNISVYGFNTFSLDTDTKLDYLFYSRFYAAPHIQNVIVGTIFLAVNLGFKEINVLGFDHSWTEELKVNAKNEVCLISKHFYDEGVKYELAPFYKLYGGVYKMHEALFIYAKMFYGYHVLNRYARYKSVKIYNCTAGSYVDAFERKLL